MLVVRFDGQLLVTLMAPTLTRLDGSRFSLIHRLRANTTGRRDEVSVGAAAASLAKNPNPFIDLFVSINEAVDLDGAEEVAEPIW